MPYRFPLLISFLFAFIACTDTVEDSRIIKIESIDFADWDELIEIVEAVPLEEDSACFISMAEQIKPGNQQQADHKYRPEINRNKNHHCHSASEYK